MSDLSHLDKHGHAHMVDISDKASTQRLAVAEGAITMQPQTLSKVLTGDHAKGDVLATARIAGIQAAKKCADLIPLCHPLPLTKVSVEFTPNTDNNAISIRATCKLNGKTGVEMEALTAVSIAALTIYDMCKAVDKTMSIGSVKVLEKQGGQSGHWRAS